MTDVQVRGTYLLADSTAARGQITFTPRVAAVNDATGGDILVNSIVRVTLDAAGAFTVTLQASDDLGLNPTGWTYRVAEDISGIQSRSYDIAVPSSAAVAGIDLVDVAPAAASAGDPSTFPTLASVAAIAARVHVLEVASPAPSLVGASGLRRWRRALADAMTVPAVITCYGDSITQGNDADNGVGGGSLLANYRDRGWPAQLRKLFAASYGSNPGEGYVMLDNSGQEPRLTFTGGTLSTTVGPMQYGFSFNGTAQTLALAVPAGTAEVDVISWWPTSAGVPWTYTWDGAAAPGTTGASGTTGDRFVTQTLTPPDSGAHTLTIRGVAGGLIYLSGFRIWATTTAARVGVVVGRMGRPGVETANATNSGASGSNRDRTMRAAFQATGTHLAAVMLGTNDYWYQPSGHAGSGVTPAVYSANLQYLIDCVTGNNSKTLTGGNGTGAVLLIAGPRRPAWDLPDAPLHTEEEYYTAMRALAGTNDHVGFIDLAEAWGSNAVVVAAGLASAANVHPYRVGHGDIARIVHSALVRADIIATP